MQARCLMLARMNLELQRQHENYQYASQIYKHLEDLFQTPERLMRYSVMKKGRGSATKVNKGTSESGPSQDSQEKKPCVHCGKTGHWFCKEYVAALAKGNFLSII